jgi:hypothetical protein
MKRGERGSTMRAYQLPQATGIDALVKVDLPTPKPGPRQALIKVAACSLNFRDLAIALGTYRMPTKPGLVPLSDGAGEVVEIGTGVTRVRVGDRVAGCFFQRWIGGPPTADTHSSALGGSIDGMLREYPLKNVFGVTDRLLQTLDTLAILVHRPQKLFERNTLLAMHRISTSNNPGLPIICDHARLVAGRYYHGRQRSKS